MYKKFIQLALLVVGLGVCDVKAERIDDAEDYILTAVNKCENLWKDKAEPRLVCLQKAEKDFKERLVQAGPDAFKKYYP